MGLSQQLGEFQSASKNLDCAKMQGEIIQIGSQKLKTSDNTFFVFVLSTEDIFMFKINQNDQEQVLQPQYKLKGVDLLAFSVQKNLL
jgi:hypothetical protein